MKKCAAPYLLIASLVFLFPAFVAAQNPDLIPHAAPSCGAATVQFDIKKTDTHAEPQVDAGKALVYLVEEQKFKNVRDVTVRVGIDGEWVGATRGTSYLTFPLEPGDHHLCVDFLSEFLSPGRLVSLYGFNAEPGKVYYFRARTAASVSGSGRRDIATLDLELVNDDQGKLLVANAPLSVSHPKK